MLLVRRVGGARPYAMKVLDKQKALVRKGVFIKRLQDELAVLQLEPHAVVAHLAYGFHDERYIYLVMTYLPGGDVRALLKREGRLDVERTRRYVAQVTLGLGHLHQFGFVWRDLKPENLIAGGRGQLCLIDFGLARVCDSPHSSRTFCG